MAPRKPSKRAELDEATPVIENSDVSTIKKKKTLEAELKERLPRAAKNKKLEEPVPIKVSAKKVTEKKKPVAKKENAKAANKAIGTKETEKTEKTTAKKSKGKVLPEYKNEEKSSSLEKLKGKGYKTSVTLKKGKGKKDSENGDTGFSEESEESMETIEDGTLDVTVPTKPVKKEKGKVSIKKGKISKKDVTETNRVKDIQESVSK